jgi:hypothetical protein
MKKGLAHGKGTYTLSNSSVYNGNWKYDLKHGKGIEIFDDN